MNYLLQQIVVDMATNWIPFKVKVDVHIFPKSARVIVPVGLGIAKGLQNDVGLDEDIFYSENIKKQGRLSLEIHNKTLKMQRIYFDIKWHAKASTRVISLLILT